MVFDAAPIDWLIGAAVMAKRSTACWKLLLVFLGFFYQKESEPEKVSVVLGESMMMNKNLYVSGLSCHMRGNNVLLTAYSTTLFIMAVLLGPVVQFASGTVFFFEEFHDLSLSSDLLDSSYSVLWDKFSAKPRGLARFAVVTNGAQQNATFSKKYTRTTLPNQSHHYVYVQPQTSS